MKTKRIRRGTICARCGHLIYYTKYFGYRCGPGCDKVETHKITEDQYNKWLVEKNTPEL
jgi:hypothetical protein